MIFAIFLSCSALVCVWYLSRKLGRANADYELLLQRFEAQERRIASLTQRIWHLEGGVSVPPPPVPPPPSLPHVVTEPLVGVEPVTAVPEPVAHAPEQVTSDDWETRLGTNWLNRAGALILVVGIALFLGYSLTQLGPGGKVVIGWTAGLSLVLAGTLLERQETYRTFAYSLVGAGWAVTYFTAYAMHGLPAARVIEDPAKGTAILLLVSCAMIAHALRYRSETATALAYLFGFVSLNLSPLTSFSVVASLFLAFSLITLAQRLDWFRLPLAGVVFTYFSFVLRYDPTIYSREGLLNGQSTLWIYWLAFETYDLLDLRRRGAGEGLERSLFLLNACGFVGASILHQEQMSAHQWATYFAAASVAYGISSVLRARCVRDAEGLSVLAGYEAASTVSAGLMAAALVARFEGVSITLALLLEGEAVFLAGLVLAKRYLCGLGGGVLALSFFRLLFVDISAGERIPMLGLRLEDWTLAGILMIAVFALNRRLVPGSWPYSGGAAIVLFAVLLAELPEQWVAPACAALAVSAFLVGERFGQPDLRWIAFPAGLVAAVTAVVINVDHSWIATSILVVVLTWAQQLLWRGRFQPVPAVLSTAGTGLLTALVFHEVSGRLLTVACGLEGAGILALGFVFKDRSFRISGLLLFLLCVGKLFVHDLSELDTGSRILSFIVLGVVLLAASWVYTRYREKLRRLL